MPMKFIALFSLLLLALPLQANTITLAAAPFETYVSNEGEPSRLTHLIQLAFSRMETDVNLEVMRDAFLGSAMRSGKIDGNFAYVDLGQKKDTLLLSAQYLPLYLYAAAKGDQVQEIKLIPHLKDNRVAIENRFANTPIFRQLKEIKWSRNPTTYDAFKQLADDRAPYLITSRLLIEAFNVLLNDDNEELLQSSGAPLITTGFSLALRSDVPNAQNIIDQFERAITTLQNDGSYNQILGIAWITSDINNDGIADYIGASNITSQQDALDSAYPLTNAPTSSESLFVIDGTLYTSKKEALAQLPPSSQKQVSVLDPDVYNTMIKRW